MAKLLAIDYGEKRIGLATSDEDQQFSFEYDIWPADQFFNKILGLLQEMKIQKIILGYPLNLSGGHSIKTNEVIEFKEKLESVAGVPIELLDERFSSKYAAQMAGTNKNIDALAAQIFLQTYLDLKNNQLKQKQNEDDQAQKME